MSTKKKPGNGKVEILIVEDSPTQAEQLKYLLEKNGYVVLTASNGKSALTLSLQHKPMIIISDIVMPEMDGYELCRQVKASADCKSIPVVLLTSLSNPADVIKGLECGADNFITKPYDEEYLITRIQYLLSNINLQYTETAQVGLTIHFGKQQYFINSTRLQIFNLLLSTYETAIQKNNELKNAQEALRKLNQQLEEKVRERTAELIAEAEERKRAEMNVERLNSVLRALRNVNQLITKENDRDNLIRGACDNLTKTRGYQSGWIALFDDAGKLIFATESGLGKAFLPLLKQLQHGKLTECQSYVLRQPGLFIKDASSNCTDCPLATICYKKTTIAARLEYGTSTHGVLAVSLPTNLSPDMEEQSLFQELADDIAFGLYKIEMEEQRKRAEHALQERHKELNCLYNISSLVELQEHPLDELLNRIVMLIPPALRFPEVTEACIILEGQTFQTERFRETSWMLAREILVNGETVGQVEVCYLEEPQASDEEPFIMEERNLLNAIAERLGHIIERTRAQKKLEESEEQLRASLENAPDGVYMSDVEGKFIYGNHRCEEIIGYSREELIGKNFLELNILPANSLARAAELLQANTEGKSTGPDELDLVRKDGSRVPVEINTSVLQRRGQKVVLAFVRDISERRSSAQLLQDVFNTSTIGMYIVQHGKFQLVNPQFQNFTKYGNGQLIGRASLSLVLPEDRAMVKESAVSMLKGQRSMAYEFRYVDKNGSTKWALESVSSINYLGERAILGSFMDITEAKKIEEQMIMSSKLVSVGELASGVAHELNNPLAGVMGYAQLLTTSSNIPPEIKEDLDKIYSESQRAVKVVQNLLRFARRYPADKKYVDINELIEKTLELRSYELRTSNIELTTRFASDIPLVLADSNQLQQVVLNIVINAEHALAETKRKGKIVITTNKNKDFVTISIADNGPGIAPEHINKILEPFFTTKPAGKGSGLGLSVCHGIIAEHGGSIHIKSTLGKGATFVIELPVPAEEEQVIADKDVVQEKPRHRRGMMKSILLVDDEPTILDVLSRFLTQIGHRVQTVSSGEDALQKLAENTFDLCITDLWMPGMSGAELYRRIEKIYPDMSQRMVFATGDTISQETHDFLSSTGRPYLSKPFDYEKLIEIIEGTLKEG